VASTEEVSSVTVVVAISESIVSGWVDVDVSVLVVTSTVSVVLVAESSTEVEVAGETSTEVLVATISGALADTGVTIGLSTSEAASVCSSGITAPGSDRAAYWSGVILNSWPSLQSIHAWFPITVAKVPGVLPVTSRVYPGSRCPEGVLYKVEIYAIVQAGEVEAIVGNVVVAISNSVDVAARSVISDCTGVDVLMIPLVVMSIGVDVEVLVTSFVVLANVVLEIEVSGEVDVDWVPLTSTIGVVVSLVRVIVTIDVLVATIMGVLVASEIVTTDGDVLVATVFVLDASRRITEGVVVLILSVLDATVWAATTDVVTAKTIIAIPPITEYILLYVFWFELLISFILSSFYNQKCVLST
jgi:hypothetical protein